MRQPILHAMFLVAGTAGAGWSADAVAPVGSLDLQDLVVIASGTTTFTPNSVAEELRDDSEVIAAANPFAERASLLKVLSERCALGYAACGFPSADVHATVAGDAVHRHLEVLVREGQRVRWGALLLKDQAPSIETALRALLCAAHPPRVIPGTKPDPNPIDESALFNAGKPARFDPGWKEQLAVAIRTFYSDQGFLGCEPIIEIGAPHDGVVDCVARLAAPPKPSAISAITVRGAERNGDARILAWLGHTRGLAPGAPALLGSIDAARKALKDSGCFLASAIEIVDVREGHSELVNLAVTVTEDADLPLFGDEPTTVQRALLGAHDQTLASLEAGSCDVEVDGPVQGFAVYFRMNPKHGMILAVKSAVAGSDLDAACLADETGISLWSRRRKLRLTLPFPHPELHIEVTTNAPDKEGNRSGLAFSARYPHGIQDNLENRISIDLAPAFFFLDSTKAIQDGTRIRMSKETASTLFDPSGPLYMDIRSYGPGKVEQSRMLIQKRPWEKSVADLIGEPSAYAPAVGHRLPLFEAISFLLEEALAASDDPARRACCETWWRAAADTLDPLARAWLADHASLSDDADNYFIPPVPGAQTQFLQTYVQTSTKDLLEALHDTWRPDQWPALLIHGVSDVICGHAEHADELIKALTSPDAMGPLGYAVCAWLAGRVNLQVGRAIATAGYAHLSAEEFSADCLKLFGSPKAVRVFLAKVDDPTSAVALLPETWRNDGLKLIAAAKRADSDDDDRRIVATATFLFWESGGSALVERWLKSLATESTPAPAGVPP